MAELKTYGDLKKVIKAISLKQKGEKVGNVALDTIVGLVPGLDAAKTTFDFIRAAISKPDDKKTKTWLDRLDIDDDMSAIVDDTVENGFMKAMAQTIEKEPDTKELEQDFNMNAKMVNYLSDKYGGRHIAGITEGDCCKRGLQLEQTANRLLLSEGMIYHLDNKIDLNESIYRPQSAKFLELFEEARSLYDNKKLQLSEQDEWYFTNTELGKWGTYEGIKVPLDFPMTLEFLMEVKGKSKKKQPELNKPKRGGPKKFYVYVRKPGGGIKKVTFGDTTGLSAKINNPQARKSFAARHKCAQAKDKTTPKYWSCRLPRYSSLLGLKSNFTGFW
jgi:hypothetical protein